MLGVCEAQLRGLHVALREVQIPQMCPNRVQRRAAIPIAVGEIAEQLQAKPLDVGRLAPITMNEPSRNPGVQRLHQRFPNHQRIHQCHRLVGIFFPSSAQRRFETFDGSFHVAALERHLAQFAANLRLRERLLRPMLRRLRTYVPRSSYRPRSKKHFAQAPRPLDTAWPHRLTRHPAPQSGIAVRRLPKRI